MAAPPPPTKVMDGVLTNAAGMTLYTFDKDTAGSGKSDCNGPCATNWPPLLAAADAKAKRRLRDHHARRRREAVGLQGQAALPVDQGRKPGDRTGDGFNNAWRLAAQSS